MNKNVREPLMQRKQETNLRQVDEEYQQSFGSNDIRAMENQDGQKNSSGNKKTPSYQKEMAKHSASMKNPPYETECPLLQENFPKINKIPTMKEEIDSYKEQQIQQAPSKILLNHFKDYTKDHLQINREKLELEHYKFSQQDFKDQVITSKILDMIRMQQIDQNINFEFTNEYIGNLFQTQSMRIFTELLFHDNKQIMMVKTWQKVSFNCQLAYQQKTNLFKEMIDDQNPQKRDNFQQSYHRKTVKQIQSETELVGVFKSHIKEKIDEITFHIKTIQFFDPTSNMKSDPILVEQVFGQFDDCNLYDTSTLRYKNKIYFFKRIFKGNRQSIDRLFNQNYRDNQQNEQYVSAAGRGINGVESELHLFSYDLCELRTCNPTNLDAHPEEDKGHENLEQFRIAETNQMPKINNEVMQLHNSVQGLIILLNCKYPAQYNVVFTEPFGINSEQKYQKASDFLINQYFTLQQHERKENIYPFKIFKMEHRHSSAVGMMLLYDSEKVSLGDELKEDRIEQINRQIQVANHTEITYPEKVVANKIILNNSLFFILQNTFSVVQIKINTEKTKDKRSYKFDRIQSFERSQQGSFQKIWNNNGIQIQSYKGPEELTQYFFIDSRNKIQLIFPNYEYKIDRVKHIEMIQKEASLQNVMNFNQYKKITCIIQEKKNQPKEVVNVFQSYVNLQNILDKLGEKITSGHQVTFCQDNSNNQILYLININSRQPKIVTVTMAEHRPEESEIYNKQEIRRWKTDVARLSSVQNQPHMYRQLGSSLVGENDPSGLRLANFPQSAQLYDFMNGQDKDRDYIQQDDEDKNPYLWYYLKMNFDVMAQMRKVSLKKEEARNHVYLANFQGDKAMKVKTYELGSGSQLPSNQKVVLIFYQLSDEYASFIFQIFNYQSRYQTTKKENTEDDEVDGKNEEEKKSYIFVRRDRQEMRNIFRNRQPILKYSDTVQILKAYQYLDDIEFMNIKNYQFEDTQRIKDFDFPVVYNQKGIETKEEKKKREQKIEDAKTAENNRQLRLYKQIKLHVATIDTDDTEKLNFIPIIYQEIQNTDNNKLMIFDINKNEFGKSISINPSLKSQIYMYEDDTQFHCFTMCRTSEIHKQNIRQDLTIQRAKYQLFTFFTEKLGLIICNEFLITHSSKGINSEIQLQTVGNKIILFSKQVIQNNDWISIKDSTPYPYRDDRSNLIKGCRLGVQLKQDQTVDINMKEQECNNIYQYQSSVINCGTTKFIINSREEMKSKSNNNEQYIIVSSTLLRTIFIEQEIFDPSEADQVLNKAQLIGLGMRIPDLNFLMLNNFDTIKKNEFFRTQEVLFGKSIMEICMSAPESISAALKNFKDEFEDLENSVIHNVTSGDKVRKDCFQEIGLYPKNMLLQMDLNYRGTIERAIEQQYTKALKQLIEFFFEHINSSEYNFLMLHDLPKVLDNKQVEINEFFRVSQMTQTGKKSQQQKEFCNIEIPILNPNVPVFSDKQQEFQRVTQELEQHNLSKQLTELIIRQYEGKPAENMNYEVTHKYIDFQYLIIGEKIRLVNDSNVKGKFNKDKLCFDDLYYSKFMIKGAGNLDFYLEESVQKFIEFQWEQCRPVMMVQFLMYVFLYLLPICLATFNQKYPEFITQMLMISCFPAVVLLCIEIIQMREAGMDYFTGWNILDLMQLINFAILITMNQLDFQSKMMEYVYIPEQNLLLIILAFAKLLQLIRIFDQLGFLVQMIIYCIDELIPFICFYLTLLVIFTLCFRVLNLEFDPEVGTVSGLPHFPKLLLQTFRDSIGELAMPQYQKMLDGTGNNLFKTINETLIWLIWFIQTFIMLVIMLNFLIAVITSTYERLSNYQRIISYQQKATLNDEVFQLMKVFKNFWFVDMPSYKIVVFSTSKEASTLEDNEIEDRLEYLKREIAKEFNKIEEINHKVDDKINTVKVTQKALVEKMARQFSHINERQDKLVKTWSQQPYQNPSIERHAQSLQSKPNRLVQQQQQL